MTNAYAGNMVWPAQISLTPNLFTNAAASHFCPPLLLPAVRRYMTVESGPIVNASPTLALALWDMDSGQQIGGNRVFAGFSTYCPLADGTGAGALVPEAFLSRNQLNTWPADAATATAQSDVVHQVSGADLSDLASYQLASVPDASQANRYWPAEVTALMPAPDASSRFAVGTIMTSYADTAVGRSAQFVQLLGPGLASPSANEGTSLILGADWGSGQIYTVRNVDPFPLFALPFTPSAGADSTSIRTIRTGLFVPQLWYASPHLLHLNDGSTLQVSDGSAGPRLPYASGQCGYSAGMLVCLDSINDQLVKLDPDTLSVTGSASLGSFLRGLTNAGPNFGAPNVYLGGVAIVDDSTFIVSGQLIHVGHWTPGSSPP